MSENAILDSQRMSEHTCAFCDCAKMLWEKFEMLDDEAAALIDGGMREQFNSSNENVFDELLSGASNVSEWWRYICE